MRNYKSYKNEYLLKFFVCLLQVKILLQKQRKTIEKLEKEKTELLTNLNCVKCPTHENKDEKSTNKLKELLQQHDKLDQEIKYEKSQLNELEYQIKKVEKEVYIIKKKYRVKESNLEEMKEQQRAQQQLENRLDVVSEFEKIGLYARKNNLISVFICNIWRDTFF